jgi:hypothetical protein
MKLTDALLSLPIKLSEVTFFLYPKEEEMTALDLVNLIEFDEINQFEVGVSSDGAWIVLCCDYVFALTMPGLVRLDGIA